MGSYFGTLPVDCIVIDTETGFIKLGLAKELCKLMNGSYYAMDTITADGILRVSREVIMSRLMYISNFRKTNPIYRTGCCHLSWN